MAELPDLTGWTVSSAWFNTGGSGLCLIAPDGSEIEFDDTGGGTGNTEVSLADLIAIVRKHGQPQSDEDKIRDAMTEATEYPGRIITR